MEDIAGIRLKHGLDLITTDQQARKTVQSLKTNLGNSLRNLSEELYTKDLHFVLEFIQNADDNIYPVGVKPTLIIKLEGRNINILCNEIGFTSQNVHAICSVGKSTKKNPQGYIGEKGIGFKAVFTVADIVHILSGRYSFKFDNSGSEELGMIAPIWTTEYPVESGWTTFRLSIPSRIDIGNLSQKLSDIEPTLLLFLRKLRHLKVIINGREHRISRRDTADGMTYLTSNTERGYLVVKHTMHNMPDDQKRPNISESEIILAFPVSASGEPIAVDQNVHTFLPLRSFGFKFIIQADFLTTSNREDILVNRPWNIALRDAIPAAFCDSIAHFRSRPGMKYDWLQYVPCHVPSDFMTPIVKRIKERIRLYGEDGQLYPATRLIVVPPEYRTRSLMPLVPVRFMNNIRYLAGGYNATRDASILEYLGVTKMTPDDLISGLNRMGDEHIQEQGQDWLERVCSSLRNIVNQRRSSYKNRVKALSLVPLDDGSWVPAQTPGVFFVDSNLCDIPHDLPVRFIRSMPSGSDHCRLLKDLDLKEASASEIVQMIVARHDSWTSPDADAVLSHAKFLFKHDPFHAARLSVQCSDGTVREAESVYMDHRNVKTATSLTSLLESYGAPILHHDYYTAFRTNSWENRRWLDWLRDELHVNTSPRLENQQFGQEFQRFIAEASFSDVLQVLRDHWDVLGPELRDNCAAKNTLSAIQVRCSDGVVRRLDATYMPCHALRRFTDLPFVVLPSDSNGRGWNFLAHLGVTFEVDVMFHLKRFVDRSQSHENSDTEQEVMDLYTQLSARFNDGDNQDKIREAFRDHRLIYIPASDRAGQLDAKDHWFSSTDVFWHGPRSVFSKRILSSVMLYGPFKILFFEQLQIPNCPDDILLQELRIVAEKLAGKPLSVDEHTLVFRLLRDLSDIIAEYETKGTKQPLPWLRLLQTLAVFPAFDQSSEVRLYEASKIFNPRGSGSSAELFRGRVPLLESPRDYRLGHLDALLGSEACHGMKLLQAEVRKEESYSGTRHLDVPTSERYLLRWPYIQRLALAKQRASRNIIELEDLVAYQVQDISCQYVLGDLKTEPKAQSLMITGDYVEKKLIVLMCKAESTGEGQNDFELAKAMAAEWRLDLRTVVSILTASTPQTVELLLQHMDIPELDVLLKESCRSDSVTSWHAQSQEKSAKDGMSASVVSVPSRHYPTTAEGEIAASTSKSQHRAEREPKAAFEIEWKAFIQQCGVEIQGLVQRRALSSNLAYLEDLSADFVVARPSAACISVAEPHSARSHYWTGPDPESVLSVALSSNISPLAAGKNGWYGPSPGSSRVHRVSSFSSNAEEFATGALGELYVYRLLLKELPAFTADNWTSKLRHYASSFEFEPYTQESTADFVYQDEAGVLTSKIFGSASGIGRKWSAPYPRYHLEVKSTVRGKAEPFHFTLKQLRTASSMAICDAVKPTDVYVLVRVWNVRSEDMEGIECEVYPDPHKMLYNGRLRVVSAEGVSVAIQD